jgi:hypothetical protein
MVAVVSDVMAVVSVLMAMVSAMMAMVSAVMAVVSAMMAVMFVAGLRFDWREKQRSDQTENEEEFLHGMVLVELNSTGNGSSRRVANAEQAGRARPRLMAWDVVESGFTWPPPP